MTDSARDAHELMLAFHEAGHAVVGLDRKCTLVFVTIAQGGEGPHCCWHPGLFPDPGIDVAHAGELAGNRCHRELGGAPQDEHGLERDRKQADGYGYELGYFDEAREQFLELRKERLRIEMQGDALWTAVQRVAYALLSEPTRRLELADVQRAMRAE